MALKYFLFIAVASLIKGQSLAQDYIDIPTTHVSRLYMASFRALNATSPHLFCGGTFIRDNHVLTAASCVYGRDPGTYRIHSNAVRLLVAGSGTAHIAHRVFIHPDYNVSQPLENNLAVVLVRLADNANARAEYLEPRGLGAMGFNRFCNMFGWEGFRTTLEWTPLRMFPIVITNGTANGTICEPEHSQAHCTAFTNLTSEYANCGGLMGSPIFCTGSISGVVVRDNFCRDAELIGGSFLPIADFEDWINEKAAANLAGASTILLLVSFALFFKNRIQ